MQQAKQMMIRIKKIDELDREESLSFPQNSEEWFERRKGKITCSMFHIAMASGNKEMGFGKTALKYAQKLAKERITGERDSGYHNHYMDWGHLYEDQAIQTLEYEINRKILPISFILLDVNDSIGGTPDGIIMDHELVTIQIKCPMKLSRHNKIVKEKKVPAEYRKQVQGEIMVTGADYAIFASYHPLADKILQPIIVKPNEAMINKMYARLERFEKLVNREVDKLMNLNFEL